MLKWWAAPLRFVANLKCCVSYSYLVDRANMLLLLEEQPDQQRPLSLQEGLSLMVWLRSACAGCAQAANKSRAQVSLGVSMERYLVMCFLLRAGYIVRR